MLIVACPSLELVPSHVTYGGWDRFYPKGSAESGDDAATVPCLLPIAPAEVLRSREYPALLWRVGGGAHHMVMSQPSCSPLSVFEVRCRPVIFSTGGRRVSAQPSLALCRLYVAWLVLLLAEERHLCYGSH